jgi:hypothetical protein
MRLCTAIRKKLNSIATLLMARIGHGCRAFPREKVKKRLFFADTEVPETEQLVEKKEEKTFNKSLDAHWAFH